MPDEEKFENYLKQFRPAVPEPLPTVARTRNGRRWVWYGALAAASALVVVALIVPYWPPRPDHEGGDVRIATRVEGPGTVPLTIGSANALLAKAPSLKAAVDAVAAQALQSRSSKPAEERQSALTVLGKEKIKL